MTEAEKMAAWEAGYEMGARARPAVDADAALIEAIERRMVPDLSEDDGEAFDALCDEIGAGYLAGCGARAAA